MASTHFARVDSFVSVRHRMPVGAGSLSDILPSPVAVLWPSVPPEGRLTSLKTRTSQVHRLMCTITSEHNHLMSAHLHSKSVMLTPKTRCAYPCAEKLLHRGYICWTEGLRSPPTCLICSGFSSCVWGDH